MKDIAYTPPQYHPSVFTIDQCPYAWDGFTNGDHWNGWATPVFEKAQAVAILEETQCIFHYDQETDSFVFRCEGEEDEDTIEMKGQDILVSDETRHVYQIGTGWWVWDDLQEWDVKNIACCECGTQIILEEDQDKTVCPKCGKTASLVYAPSCEICQVDVSEEQGVRTTCCERLVCSDCVDEEESDEDTIVCTECSANGWSDRDRNCEQEWDKEGAVHVCLHGCIGCLYNSAGNICMHPSSDRYPLGKPPAS